MSLETQEDLCWSKTFHEESRPPRANNYSGLSLNHLHLAIRGGKDYYFALGENAREKLSCKRLFQEHGEVDDRLNVEEFARARFIRN